MTVAVTRLDASASELRDRVHRYNASGLAGLFNLPRRNGPLPRLSARPVIG